MIPIPTEREDGLRRVLDGVADARRVVLTTHVNADGDGAGSEAAVAAWLTRQGKEVSILNPTPFPDGYRHLVERPGQIRDVRDEAGRAAAAEADLFLVLDTSEPRRIGRVLDLVRDRPTLIIDHHPPTEPGIPGYGVLDPSACATGELVYDLLQLATGPDAEWAPAVLEGVYTAIVTDTGSFRFSNTTARAHRIVADLIERGVDPEAVYRRLFATVPLRRLEFLRRALEHLEVDAELPLTWITIPREVTVDMGATSEDLDGIVEHARSVEGTEVAVVFRQTPDGATKVSFRSNGEVDVNALARKFGGGGHVKASGALIGASLDAVRDEVLEAARDALRALERPGEIE